MSRQDAVIEEARRFHCGSCAREVWVCTGCDRGQRYCSPACALQARRQSSRRAGREFRGREPGRLGNARRQREWYWRHRAARQKTGENLTHQGSAERQSPSIILAPKASQKLSTVESRKPGPTKAMQILVPVPAFEGLTAPSEPAPDPSSLPLRCHFCGGPCCAKPQLFHREDL